MGLTAAAPVSSSWAQAPSLGTAGSFAVLAGSTVTNTGPTVIDGDVGVSPGSAVTGFPPGIVNGVIHAADAVASQAQLDNLTAYNTLAGRPIASNLTGQDLGGKTLIAGVYGFNTSAQLTGQLILDGQGNPNSVFIINIGSTLTTASGSSILLINGAQGGNVFFRVGSSATLGTATSFTGDILALTSITLNTGATLICGAAFAQNGAVTLDTNTIRVCTTTTAPILPGTGGSGTGGTGTGSTPVVPPQVVAVAGAINTAIAGTGGSIEALPTAFQTLIRFASPSELADILKQLSGEAATGTAQAGTQAMNSFLSQLTSPFPDSNRATPENRPAAPMVTKGPMVNKAAPLGSVADPRRWGIWAAGYGGQTNAAGDVAGIGSHDRSASFYGYASGLDYRVTPSTVVGFALAGGATSFGLSDNLGGGRSDMFQAALYGSTHVNAAYVSAAVAYAWHQVTTERFLNVLDSDHLTADFSAYNIGGRIEGGYRFALPGAMDWPGRYGLTPYAAGQVQVFHTPSYSEIAVSGSSAFALTYDARTTTTLRTELGAWLDWSSSIDHHTALVLRTRAAWAHDEWSSPSINARFQSLPGSASFTVVGAEPASDLLLVSAGAEFLFRNGFSIAARFDGEFAEGSRKYAGTGRLRYTW